MAVSQGREGGDRGRSAWTVAGENGPGDRVSDGTVQTCSPSLVAPAAAERHRGLDVRVTRAHHGPAPGVEPGVLCSDSLPAGYCGLLDAEVGLLHAVWELI